MLKVNNKKTITHLVLSNLKQYKMRNLFTLVTIVLSVSLIAGLAFMSAAIEETARKELSARQHVIYHDVNQTQIKKLSNTPEISSAKEFKQGQSFESDDYIMVPYYIEPSESSMLKLDIVKGTYPTKMNEVLVYDQMLVKMGIEPNIGESLSITYLDGTTEEYVVSGLLKSETTDTFSVYFSKEYAVNGSQLKNLPFNLSAQIVDAQKMGNEEFLSLIRKIGADFGVERKNINENNAFVDSLSYDSENVIIISLLALAILLVSVLVIYSIFYISISEKTRQFGQLRTLGMTKKQVKRMVRKEGTILSLAGSTMGITIGAVFAFSMRPKGFNLVIFGIYTVAIFLANYITVQVSIAKPAKLAAAVSPIEATKMSGYEIKTKKAATKKMQRSLTPISLSIIGAKGNRKKSIMTMISLCLAGIVFMSASSFINSTNEEKYSRQTWFNWGEYVLDISSNAIKVNEYGETGIQVSNPLSDEFVSDLQKINGVKAVTPMQTLSTTYTYNDVTEEDIAAPFAADDSELISSHLESGKIDYQKMIDNKEIVIAHNDIVKEIFGWQFEVGDTIKLKWYNGEKKSEDTFTIAGILQPSRILNKNDKMHQLSYNAGWFMVPQGLLDKMMVPNFNLNTRIIVSTKDYWNTEEGIEKDINSLIDGSPLLKLATLKSSMEHNKKSFDRLNLIYMGAALFVIAFSVINLLNTLISNTMARKSEFASLGAIGASNRQIRTMILGEGIYFAIVNILFTITLGTLTGFGLVQFAKWNGVSYLVYKLPWIHLIGYCVFVLTATLFISLVIAKIIRKKSLVEQLREVE